MVPGSVGPCDLGSMAHTFTWPGPKNVFHLLGEVLVAFRGSTFTEQGTIKMCLEEFLPWGSGPELNSVSWVRPPLCHHPAR